MNGGSAAFERKRQSFFIVLWQIFVVLFQVNGRPSREIAYLCDVPGASRVRTY